MQPALAAMVLALLLPVTAWTAGGSAPGVAREWLSSVDRGAYAESWNRAGAFLKSHVSRREWARNVGEARRPWGGAVSRTLSSRTEAASLPDAPDGRYTVLTFDTTFLAGHHAVETVTLADGPTGWKVDGYFIRPASR